MSSPARGRDATFVCAKIDPSGTSKSNDILFEQCEEGTYNFRDEGMRRCNDEAGLG